MRLAVLLAASVLLAPMQCKRDPDPSLRREDTAGDALFGLAQDFKAKGHDEASRATLRYLVERYPSNRHAPAARAELGLGDAPLEPGAAGAAEPAGDGG